MFRRVSFASRFVAALALLPALVRRRTRSSPTSPSACPRVRSRPARRAARSDWPSTTSCCALRRSSAPTPSTQGRASAHLARRSLRNAPRAGMCTSSHSNTINCTWATWGLHCQRYGFSHCASRVSSFHQYFRPCSSTASFQYSSSACSVTYATHHGTVTLGTQTEPARHSCKPRKPDARAPSVQPAAAVHPG